MSTTPPGWFPVAGSPGVMRWWDGTQWTDKMIQQMVAPPLQGATGPSTFPAAGKVALVGAAAGLVGSFLPWVSVQSFISIEVTGFDGGDGKITAGAAVAALLLGFLGLSNSNRAPVVVGIVASVIGLAVSVYDWVNVNDKVSSADLEFARASVGYGLYLCVAGFAACTVGLLAANSKIPTSSATQASPFQPGVPR